MALISPASMLALKFGPHSDFSASDGDFYHRQLNWFLKHAFEYRFIVARRKKIVMMVILASSLHVTVSAVASVGTTHQTDVQEQIEQDLFGNDVEGKFATPV